MDLVVRTSSGSVRGSAGAGVTRFLGIPYAAAPEGPLRFQGPAPVVPWSGERDATRFGVAPPQGPLVPGMPSPWSPGDGVDSLSVNVYVPEGGGTGLPVMVWIYGGAYQNGSSSLPGYDATRLAESGVVVVTLNYRLGFDGFGVVPGAPANRGLLDQVAALRWVRSEIAAFGGDPANVTVFGESAGAGSIAVLLAADLGLFRRAIAQSVPSGYRSLEQAREVTRVVADELGIDPSDFASVPLEAVLAAQSAPLRRARIGITAFGPVVDGDLLTDQPWNLIARGAGRDVELVCGFTHDEFRLFSTMIDLSAATPEDIVAAGPLPDSALADYRAAYPGLADRELIDTIMSDSLFRMPTTWTAQAHAAAGGRTWLYDFAWEGPLGACHGIDVPFTFGIADSPIAAMVLGSPVPDSFEALSAALRASWTGFARTGDPGWAPFTENDQVTRRWDTDITEALYPIPESRDIWSAARSRT